MYCWRLRYRRIDLRILSSCLYRLKRRFRVKQIVGCASCRRVRASISYCRLRFRQLSLRMLVSGIPAFAGRLVCTCFSTAVLHRLTWQHELKGSAVNAEQLSQRWQEWVDRQQQHDQSGIAFSLKVAKLSQRQMHLRYFRPHISCAKNVDNAIEATMFCLHNQMAALNLRT